MDSFRCATCRNALSIPVRRVGLPDGPPRTQLDCHHVNPPRLVPGTYAVDPAPYGRDAVAGTYVLSPGDVRGTRFVHDVVLVGCWSLVGWIPCLACDRCGSLVAYRFDDCDEAQETRFDPSMVIRVAGDDDPVSAPDPFAAIADWDSAPTDTREVRWIPEPVRRRPALTATRWRGQDLKAHLYRDDPPA